MIYLLLLVAVTAVWGTTFVLVKDAIAQYPTVPFLFIRFAIAALTILLVVRRLPSRRALLAGVPVGLALAAGYWFQTAGLERTSAGNAGLITGLFVVFTPLLEGLGGAPIPLRTWGAAAAALVGTLLLTGAGLKLPGAGDALVVACALAFAVHIVLLGRFSPGVRPGELALVQLTVAALVFSAAAVPGGLHAPPPSVWLALAITGVLASAVGFLIQTWAQAHLRPSRTALILATEPAWALLAAVAFAGQRFGAVQAVGAALVTVAIVAHEVLAYRPGHRDRKDAEKGLACRP